MARDRIHVIDGGRSGDPPNGGGSDSGGGNRGASSWQDDLTRTKTGDVKATMHNVMTILSNDPDVKDLFWLDEFTNKVGMSRYAPWLGGTRDEFAESDATELAAWVGHPRRFAMPARLNDVMQGVEAIARRAKKHPVREYLRSIRWDGKPRIERMFVDLFGAEDMQYELDAAKCFMVSAVARILWVDPLVPHNGAQVDFMLVFEGPQGKGKTSAVRELFGHQWYAETMHSPASTDFYQALRGRWGVEIGEMDSFNKADVTKVKQAVTSRFDHYRPSYGRYAKSFRRECVFVGTTNENEYLRDASGGRRFLPVKTGRLQIEAIRDQRDQLWAEAVKMFDDRFEYWKLPEAAGKEQDDRFVEDSWQDPVARWLTGRLDTKYYPGRLAAACGALEWTTTTELLSWALAVDLAKHSKQDQMRVAHIMKRLGWVSKREQVDGERQRRWVREASDDPPF